MLTLFPSLDDVFESPSSVHHAVFRPLLTVDLEAQGKGEGLVHFISVWGNGNPELSLNDDMFGFNFIRFDWTGSKYHFNGDLSVVPEFARLEEWYAEAQAEYLANRIDYLTQKEFSEVDRSHLALQNERRRQISFEYFQYVSGLINYWVTRDKYLETGLFVQGSAYTECKSNDEREVVKSLSRTGATKRSNELVGSVIGYNYIRGGGDEIRLHIDRKRQQVWQKFSWS
jgi:hypothetical protein